MHVVHAQLIVCVALEACKRRSACGGPVACRTGVPLAGVNSRINWEEGAVVDSGARSLSIRMTAIAGLAGIRVPGNDSLMSYVHSRLVVLMAVQAGKCRSTCHSAMTRTTAIPLIAMCSREYWE